MSVANLVLFGCKCVVNGCTALLAVLKCGYGNTAIWKMAKKSTEQIVHTDQVEVGSRIFMRTST